MSRRYCLVLDDDRIAAAFMVELVAAQGLAVDLARTLHAANQQLAQRRYDILLVDRRLPDGDGLRWLSRVLADVGDGPTPRCLVTSGDLIDTATLPVGVGQLRKPVDAGRLCEWLASTGNPVQDVPDLVQPGAQSGWEQAALLDDAGALARFGGNRDALRSLRAMLLAELADSARWRLQLRQPTPPSAAIDALHRLRAACALTGCVRLGLVSEATETALRSRSQMPARILDDLDAMVPVTIAAMSGQQSTDTSG